MLASNNFFSVRMTNVPVVELGSAIDALTRIIDEYKADDISIIILIDHFFMDSDLVDLRRPWVHIEFINTENEPTTQGLDALVSELKSGPCVHAELIIGIGGGHVLDLAKATSNLWTNEGKASDYQGWNLVKNRGLRKIGVPTISGTGAEATRTCVLTNPDTGIKLGMNSDHSVFDQIILDSALSATVDRSQYFFTGMDTYIHCIESLSGRYRNALADANSEMALSLCREVFKSEDMMSDINRQKLMIASFLGGCAVGGSFVGLIHPLSAGLSVVYKTPHCAGNCIVMTVMDEYYPEAFNEFYEMANCQDVCMPSNPCEKASDEDFSKLFDAVICHEKPLRNALGPDFHKILTREKLRDLYLRRLN